MYLNGGNPMMVRVVAILASAAVLLGGAAAVAAPTDGPVLVETIGGPGSYQLLINADHGWYFTMRLSCPTNRGHAGMDVTNRGTRHTVHTGLRGASREAVTVHRQQGRFVLAFATNCDWTVTGRGAVIVGGIG